MWLRQINRTATADRPVNGVRIAVMPKPQLRTAGVSVFVRTGDVQKSRANDGISHLLEHIYVKGNRVSDRARISICGIEGRRSRPSLRTADGRWLPAS